MFLLAVAKSVTNDEMVKQMQEQVISMQEKQISFLNDTISNTYTVVSIVVGALGLVSAIILTWISRTNQKAQKKLEDAERVLGDAQTAKEELLQYQANLEIYREETRKEFEELTRLVNSEEIESLKESTRILTTTNEMNYVIKEIDTILKAGHDNVNALQETNGDMRSQEVKQYRICIQKVHMQKRYAEEPARSVEEAMKRLINFVQLKTECNEVVANLKQLVDLHFAMIRRNKDSSSS
ncbi:hypothetical protein [Priestia megaterium]|uniref:hypothetical protein n=1 Tax=Priestia megaterium TaxID=1404 RepID=UPI000BFE885E|nr:hypothetical protein [Priestia megaterium]PGT75544.1 hypothetical protein COD15_07320 [Priestia megaterium]